MLAQIFKTFIEREAFKNITIILAVYGIQIVIFKDIFRCPCSNHKSYGIAFLFVPASFLLGLSLIFFHKSWNVLRIVWKQNNYKTRCNYFLSSLIEFFRPFLASASWIIVALLRGECYVCIRVGPGKQCETREQKMHSVDFDHFYSQSFILGSGFLLSMVIFTTGIVCIQRCCTNSYEAVPTCNELAHVKKSAIVAAFDIKTKELVKEYAQKLVENSFSTQQDSNVDLDERFMQAREKLQAICDCKSPTGYMVDDPFTSTEITSSTI